MSKLIKSVLTLLVALGLTVAVLATASASRPKAKPLDNQPDQTLVAGRVLETAFVALTPCRLADTRKGGGVIINGASRNFRVRGSGFSGQGGAAAAAFRTPPPPSPQT